MSRRNRDNRLNFGGRPNFDGWRAVAAPLALAAFVSGCSILPDETRTGMVYGENMPAPTPEGTKGFPNLADVPTKVPTVASMEERQQLAGELSTNRSDAKQGDTDLQVATAEMTPESMGEPSRQPAAASAEAPSAEPAVAPAPAPATSGVPVASRDDEPVAVSSPIAVAAASSGTASAETASSASASSGVVEPAPEAPTPGPLDKLASASPSEIEPLTNVPDGALAPPARSDRALIPFPKRGGHASLAAARREPGVPDAPLPEPDPNAEQPVTPAPTTPVEVQPSEAAGPQQP